MQRTKCGVPVSIFDISSLREFCIHVKGIYRIRKCTYACLVTYDRIVTAYVVLYAKGKGVFISPHSACISSLYLTLTPRTHNEVCADSLRAGGGEGPCGGQRSATTGLPARQRTTTFAHLPMQWEEGFGWMQWSGAKLKLWATIAVTDAQLVKKIFNSNQQI